MTSEEFVNAVGSVFEHSPWVAERTAELRPFRSIDEIWKTMTEQVSGATEDYKLKLLRAHPDLGTRAKITESSASEQAGAGLDRLTEAEYDQFSRLNAAYRQKFGIPFLFAVKGSDKFAILKSLETRIESSRAAEFEEALRQVFRIARLRLDGIIAE